MSCPINYYYYLPQTALVGSQTLLASDLTLADLPMVASVAAGTTGLGRVVLGLRLAAEEEGVEQHAAQVDAAAALLQAAGTAYTIVKYAPLVDHQQQKQRIQSSESSFNPVGSSVTSQHPFRVVKGNVALPSATMGVTAQDLRKVSYVK